MVRTVMAIEREVEDARASKIRVLVARGRRTSLLLVWERSRRLLFRTDFRDEVATIRAKAESGLLARYGR